MVFESATYVKQMWIAVFILLVGWAVAFLVSAFFRGRTTNKTTTAHGTGHHRVFDRSTAARADDEHPSYWRANEATKKAETLFLMLLAATTVTCFGFGATKATSILAWVYLVLSLISIALSLFTRHFAPHIGLGIVSFPFIIAIFALAFRTGGPNDWI
ncbi:hypothetical protein HDV00_011376 [Rhizophlyctis rosea]|nr:hypothetical protein HDV00_011376 [Rhizophlyctis rosea]